MGNCRKKMPGFSEASIDNLTFVPCQGIESKKLENEELKNESDEERKLMFLMKFPEGKLRRSF